MPKVGVDVLVKFVEAFKHALVETKSATIEGETEITFVILSVQPPFETFNSTL